MRVPRKRLDSDVLRIQRIWSRQKDLAATHHSFKSAPDLEEKHTEKIFLMVFLRTWVIDTWRQASLALTPEARRLRATQYINDWIARLHRQVDGGDVSPLGRNTATGGIMALTRIRGRLDTGDLCAQVAAHSLRRQFESDDERRAGVAGVASRRYPRWITTEDSFENQPLERTTRARDPAQRVRELGPCTSDPTRNVGRTALKIGDRPSVIRDGAARKQYRFAVQNDYMKYVTTSPVVCNVSGSYQTSRIHLDRYGTAINHHGRPALLQQALSECFEDLRLIRSEWISMYNIVNPRVNPDAQPGLLTGALFKNRAEAYETTTVLAMELFERLKTEQLFSALPWSVGGREKRQEREIGDEVTSRLVQMPEDVFSRIECAVAEPLLDRFKRANGDIKLGMTYAHGAHKKFFARFADCDHVKALDWSSFDSYLVEDIIVCAFGVLRAMYPPGKHADNVFLYLMSGFLRRDIVCPGGDVVTMDRGVPSGSGLTSLIGSISNWLIIRSTILSMEGADVAKKVRLAVQGDDSLIGWPTTTRRTPTTKEFGEHANWLWGCKKGAAPSVGQEDGFYTSAWPELALPFLSTRSYLGWPTWNLRDIVLVDLGTKNKPRNFEEEVLAGWGAVGYPGFSPRIRDYYPRFLRWCEANRESDRLIGSTGHVADIIETQIIQQQLLLHTESGGLVEVAKFAWGEKGRHPELWTDTQMRMRREGAQVPPAQRAQSLGKLEEWNCLLKHIAVRPDGTSAGIGQRTMSILPALKEEPPPSPWFYALLYCLDALRRWRRPT